MRYTHTNNPNRNATAPQRIGFQANGHVKGGQKSQTLNLFVINLQQTKTETFSLSRVRTHRGAEFFIKCFFLARFLSWLRWMRFPFDGK